jgi:hypothetical protein
MRQWEASDSERKWLLYYLSPDEDSGILIADFIEQVGRVTFVAADPDGSVIIDSDPMDALYLASGESWTGMIAWYNPDTGEVTVYDNSQEALAEIVGKEEK